MTILQDLHTLECDETSKIYNSEVTGHGFKCEILLLSQGLKILMKPTI